MFLISDEIKTDQFFELHLHLSMQHCTCTLSFSLRHIHLTKNAFNVGAIQDLEFYDSMKHSILYRSKNVYVKKTGSKLFHALYLMHRERMVL